VSANSIEQGWLILTVVGVDQPGIVARLTETLYQAGCNLGEASMARLGGCFTILMMVEGTTPQSLEELLQPLSRSLGLRVHVDRIDSALHRHVEPNVQVTVYGADRPGIVAQVTAALAGAGFNILDLHSDVGGSHEQPIYIMIIDGAVAGGAVLIEQTLAPLHDSGIEVRVSALDTLVG